MQQKPLNSFERLAEDYVSVPFTAEKMKEEQEKAVDMQGLQTKIEALDKAPERIVYMTVCSPSGGGKSFVAEKIVDMFQDREVLVVPADTFLQARGPRTQNAPRSVLMNRRHLFVRGDIQSHVDQLLDPQNVGKTIRSTGKHVDGEGELRTISQEVPEGKFVVLLEGVDIYDIQPKTSKAIKVHNVLRMENPVVTLLSAVARWKQQNPDETEETYEKRTQFWLGEYGFQLPFLLKGIENGSFDSYLQTPAMEQEVLPNAIKMVGEAVKKGVLEFVPKENARVPATGQHAIDQMKANVAETIKKNA